MSVAKSPRREWSGVRFGEEGRTKMNLQKLIYLALASAAVGALVLWLRPSEEKRIRKVFATVSSEIQKDGPEGLVVATAKAHALADLVANGCDFDFDGHRLRGSFGGRQLLQQIILVRKQADKIKVGFEDLAITFTDERTASVTGDVYVSGLSDELGLSGRDARALETVLEKDAEEDKWLFTSVRVLPVVEK